MDVINVTNLTKRVFRYERDISGVVTAYGADDKKIYSMESDYQKKAKRFSNRTDCLESWVK